jgi:hypothetical protein
MNEKKIKLRSEGSKYFLDISGAMDEDLSYDNLQLNTPIELVVNFEKIVTINSCGIREWIRWMMQYANMKITYRLCPKVIVDQINMVDGFLPKDGIVESFFVPYFNEDTGTEIQVLFSQGKEFDQNGIHPPQEIPDNAGRPMEMDVIESKYFRFLTKKPHHAA